MTATLEATEVEATEVIASVYDAIVTEDIDFRVETRGLDTTSTDGSMHMPDHEATIRINPDGTEAPLWVVGSRYEVVDHRELIKKFAEALDKVDLPAEVEHHVYANGCRIYSVFTLDKTFPIGKDKPEARPFFTLTTSHDGSMKLGFMVGAKVKDLRFNVSKKVYGAYAKHTKGVNIEQTIKEISKALDAFMTEVLPMWEKMNSMELGTTQAQKIIDDAVAKKVISKLRAEKINLRDANSVFDIYTAMTSEAVVVTGKKATAERAFNRNTDVGEYFRKLAGADMSGLKSVLSRPTPTVTEEDEDEGEDE